MPRTADGGHKNGWDLIWFTSIAGDVVNEGKSTAKKKSVPSIQRHLMYDNSKKKKGLF